MPPLTPDAAGPDAASPDAGLPDAGVLVIDKPPGLTSHDVVARLRRVLGTRKVGHAGTLDPMATGVLVVAFGRGTRLLPYLQATMKQYEATIRLGRATTTDDSSGAAIGAEVPVQLDDAAVDAILRRFSGAIQQRPSAVSAVKVDGRRAYQRVRDGEYVELPARAVLVHLFQRLAPVRPVPGTGCLDMDVVVRCSSGTYIRALARDVGEEAGCGGHLVALRRTAVGPFAIDAASPLPGAGDPAPPVMALGEAAAQVLPAVVMDHPSAALVRRGQRQPCAQPDGAVAALVAEDAQLLAVAEAVAGQWRYRAVFSTA